MGIGKHWEWRGFGKLSDEFNKTFLTLSLIEEYAKKDILKNGGVAIEDEYLVIPHSTINVKLRTGLGEMDGLKLKYFDHREGELELWDEPQGSTLRLKDLTPSLFTNVLAPKLRMKFPAVPSGPIDAQKVRAVFCAATPGAIPVLVKKHRRTRRWKGNRQNVLVEIAEIGEPERVVSVSLESDSDLTNARDNEIEDAGESVLAALDKLSLRREELKVMNYLEILQIWARKETLGMSSTGEIHLD
jgi:hypothetical protein